MRAFIAVAFLVLVVACGGDERTAQPAEGSPPSGGASDEGGRRAEPPRGPCSTDADCSLGMGCGCTCVATTEPGYACHPCAGFPCDTSAVRAACDPATHTCVVAQRAP